MESAGELWEALQQTNLLTLFNPEILKLMGQRMLRKQRHVMAEGRCWLWHGWAHGSPYPTYITFLSISFLNCKMGMRIIIGLLGGLKKTVFEKLCIVLDV